jgi:hypothetical protein
MAVSFAVPPGTTHISWTEESCRCSGSILAQCEERGSKTSDDSDEVMETAHILIDM